jgi:uroporphyrinogen decarboxylase
MTSRERVQAALRRQPADRPPVFMWFHPVTARRLAGLLEVPASRVGEAMGDDIVQTWVNNNYAMEGIVREREGEGHRDFWGIRWEKRGAFNQPVEFPLAGAGGQCESRRLSPGDSAQRNRTDVRRAREDTDVESGRGEEEVLAYRFPVERMDFLLGRMEPLARGRGERFLGCDVSPCVFEMYWRLRGLEEALVDIAARPALAGRMFARCAAFARELAERAGRRFPLDWLWTGDDVAGQTGLILSPAAWRELVKPPLAEIFAVGRRAGLPVAFHCCGALRPILPDLVEIGMDVLNPVQAGCPGMDALELKGEFGRSIAFMGGVDTQHLLPFGSPAEVRRAIGRLIEGMTAGGGGYILAASHTIPPETPDENIFAMYEEAGIGREEIFDRAAGIRARLAAAR